MPFFVKLFQNLQILKSKSYGLLFILVFSLLIPIPTFAQTFSDFTLFPGVENIGDVLSLIIQILTAVASPIAVFLIILGGFETMVGGTKESVAAGTKKIISAAIGLGIVLMATAIENLIQGTFFGGEIDIVFLVTAIQEIVIRNATILAVAVSTLAMIWGGYKDFFKAFGEGTDGTAAVKNAMFGLSVIFLAGGFTQVITEAIDPEESNLIRSFENLVGGIGGVLESTIALMTVLAVIISIFVIVRGGYDYFFSAFSDKVKPIETIQKGVFGLVVTLLSGFLSLILFDFFGRVDNAGTVFSLDNLPTQAEAVLLPLINNAIAFAISLASIAAVCVIVYGGYIYFASAVSEQKKKGSEIITQGVIGLIVIILAGPIVRFVPQVVRGSYSDDGNATLELAPEPILKLIREFLGGFLIPVVGLVTVFFLVYAGYLWLTSRGEADQIKKARSSLNNSLIGLVVVLLATTIVGLIVFFLQPDEFVPAGGELDGPSVIETDNTQDLPSIDEI